MAECMLFTWYWYIYTTCYRLNVSFQKSFLETLTSTVMILGGEAFGSRLDLDQIIRFSRWDYCPSKKRPETLLSLLCDNTARRQPFEGEGKSYYQGSNLLAPCSWASQPSELWEIHVCLFKPLCLWNSIIAN